MFPQRDSEEFKTLGEVCIKGDANRLSQVLRNLISNALKFTPRGGRVSLFTEIVVNSGSGGDREMLRIKVSDTGAGLSQVC